MTIIGTCGHELKNNPIEQYAVSVMDYTREGDRCVSYCVFSKKCKTDHKRYGTLLETKEDEQALLDGRIEYSEG